MAKWKRHTPSCPFYTLPLSSTPTFPFQTAHFTLPQLWESRPLLKAQPARSSREDPQLHWFYFLPDTSQRSAHSSCQNSSRVSKQAGWFHWQLGHIYPPPAESCSAIRGFPIFLQLATVLHHCRQTSSLGHRRGGENEPAATWQVSDPGSTERWP